MQIPWFLNQIFCLGLFEIEISHINSHVVSISLGLQVMVGLYFSLKTNYTRSTITLDVEDAQPISGLCPS
jgi:hypothetical protein